MLYPAFFDAAPTIRLRDPLAAFLGATEDGVLEYRYVDVVKLAGHSCPTVASTFLMTRRALQALYPGALPERGNICVSFSKGYAEGTTGLMANVVGMLTGAASDGGFKGLAGSFDRRDKLYFDGGFPGLVRFSRLDTGDEVEASINLQAVPADRRLPELLSKCLNDVADLTEACEFRQLWQDRVRALLLEHANDKELIAITNVT